MKRGTKSTVPATKAGRGTYRPDRDGGIAVVATSSELPQQPEWLTDAGRQVWLDDIGRASSVGFVNELDSTAFGNYCNLQGAMNACWASGAVPPAAYQMEVRKLQEQFGLMGTKSRVGAAPQRKTDNPFDRLANMA